MRKKRLTHRSGLKSGLFLAGILVLLAGAIYIVGWSGIFAIKTISCGLDGEKECSEEIVAELNLYVGKKLLLIRKSEIETRLTTADRLLDTVDVNLKLPSSLVVEISSRKPAAAITSAETIVESVEVDAEGVILDKTQNPQELPKFVWPEIVRWPIEKRLPRHVIKAVELTILLFQSFKLAGVPKVETETSLAAALETGQKVRLSLDKEPLPQMTSLQVLLNQVRIEGKTVREIDLRFDNPVIR